MGKCITPYYDDEALAKKQCPEGYHIEYSRNGFVLYILNGYYYDLNTDLCFKDSK